MSSDTCSHCGGDIPAGARSCRHCGSSDSDGWRDESEHEWDDGFDYDEFARNEFGSDDGMGTSLPRWIQWTGLTLLVAILLAWVLR
ncbi:zinc ribbon domain-containing protein [Stieleria varia]|uniref:Zinc-ribbon domain-containing protein n=1 Tax=Stieleria varia TaxID=2528005 RepID=A0A5C6AZ70_9BACT|nr:zinc ribbon domain-containing protein [Stieleria varia]TWU04449.1 hypothetical protein Pla52n_24900 [Stieleria varia]